MDALLEHRARRGRCAWSRTRRRGWAPPGAAARWARIGDAGCFSFHETKNITCGEGGALWSCATRRLAARAEIMREKGTNRSAFLRGEVDKYTWVAEGSSYVLSDVLAAMLDAQLDKFDEIQARGRAWPRATGGARRTGPGRTACGCRSGAPDRTAEPPPLLPADAGRGRARPPAWRSCAPRACMATFHYVPLHSSPVRTRARARATPRCPSPSASRARCCACPCIRCSPTHEVDRVVEAVRSSLG